MTATVLHLFGARLRLEPVREGDPKAGYWLHIAANDRVSYRAAFDWLLATVPRRERRWRRYAPPDASPAWWLSRRGVALLQAAAKAEQSAA